MVVPTSRALSSLYEADETAWLEATSELVRDRRFGELDPDSLAEYLSDMAKRDRREVLNRLVQLLLHLLKWEYQPAMRSGGWDASIGVQRLELEGLLESGTLKNHAAEILPYAYERARRLAAKETQLPLDSFPESCPWTVDDVLKDS